MKKSGTTAIVGLILYCAWLVYGQVQIALSQSSPHYVTWLKLADTTISTVDLYSLGIDKALQVIDSCDGLRKLPSLG